MIYSDNVRVILAFCNCFYTGFLRLLFFSSFNETCHRESPRQACIRRNTKKQGPSATRYMKVSQSRKHPKQLAIKTHHRNHQRQQIIYCYSINECTRRNKEIHATPNVKAHKATEKPIKGDHSG